MQKILHLAKPISVSLTTKTLRRLNAEARKQKRSRSEIVREVLNAELIKVEVSGRLARRKGEV